MHWWNVGKIWWAKKAYEVFDELCVRHIVAVECLIDGYVELGEGSEAVVDM